MAGTSSEGVTATVHLSLVRLCMLTISPFPGMLLCTRPQATLICDSPKILMIEDFLSPTECQVRGKSFHAIEGRRSISVFLQNSSQGLDKFVYVR